MIANIKIKHTFLPIFRVPFDSSFEVLSIYDYKLFYFVHPVDSTFLLHQSNEMKHPAKMKLILESLDLRLQQWSIKVYVINEKNLLTAAKISNVNYHDIFQELN